MDIESYSEEAGGSFEDERVRPVESFTSDYNGDPHQYPGERPPTSYLTDGTSVFPIHATREGDTLPKFFIKTEDGVMELDEYLRAQGVETMEQRIPVVAYGANVNPVALLEKLKVIVKEVELNESGLPVVDENGKFVPIRDDVGRQRTHTARPDLMLVPTVYATLKGFDVVQHDEPAQRGRFFAELYSGPETVNTEIQVGLNFLTKEQLLMLNATEPSYYMAGLGMVTINGVGEIPAIIYAGKSSVLLKQGEDGSLHPIALSGVPAKNRNLEAMSSAETLDYVLGLPGVQEALQSQTDRFASETATVESYTEEALARKLSGRKELLKIVGSVLATLGLKGSVTLTDTPDVHFHSWANGSLLPTFEQMLKGNIHNPEELILLPEQVLSGFPEPNRTDLLRKIRNHSRN